MALNTGCRITNCIELDWKDVDLFNKSMDIVLSKQSNQDEKETSDFDINPSFHEYLLSAKPKSKGAVFPYLASKSKKRRSQLFRDRVLKKAGIKAKGATMYVTLEPCFHTSQNDSCTDQILRSGIKEIYISCIDQDPRTKNKSINKLKRNKIKVTTGIQKNRTISVNKFFFKSLKKQVSRRRIKKAAAAAGSRSAGSRTSSSAPRSRSPRATTTCSGTTARSRRAELLGGC